jgi:hypothetical protein
MKRIMLWCVTLVALLGISQQPAAAQVSSNSSLSGSVIDPSGAVVPGVDVTITNEGTGAVYKTITAENGTFMVPSLNPGTYTVTVDAPGFKQAVMKGIAIVAATAAAVRPIKLEIGTKGETVIVQAAGEVLQTQSATVSNTIIGRQITEIPFTSRDALDLVLLMPETFTSTNPRSSVVNGLPKSTINITIDGVNVQNNEDKAGDGFYTWIRPRIDSVEQVTVSTAAQTADSGGEGAVQIKFVTRSGNNSYSGSLYEYHRNPALAANYWFNNRDYRANASKGEDWRTFKAPKDRVLLNQYGGRIGGPISLPKMLFGPLGFDGHDRAFFFFNYEEFRIPYRVLNNRTILHPDTQAGNIRYLYLDPATGVRSVKEVNLMTLAAANGQIATFDPTIQKLLADIRTASQNTGSIIAIEDANTLYANSMNPNTQAYSFVAKGGDRRYFSTARLDFNLTKKHRLENSYSYQKFANDQFDYYQGGQPQFPDFPNVLQTGSNRFSDSLTLRSTITSKIVNEAQGGVTGGTSIFGPNISAGDFTGAVANQGGFTIGLLGGISGATTSTTPNRRQNPVYQFSDTLTWTLGAHNISLGASVTQANMWYWSQTMAPSIGLGVDTTYDPATAMFTSANRPANFPGANSTDASRAQSIYAMLTGRVTSISASSVLGTDGQYHYSGPGDQRGRMRQLGFYATDSWRVSPNLTLSGGLRWDVQLAYVGLTKSYSTMTLADVWGISGVGNLYKPGTLTGSTTKYTAYSMGTPLFKNSWKVGPSFGFAWTPKFAGWLGNMFGSGKSVIRGGFNLTNSRYGSNVFSGILTSTPGRTITATRSVGNANLVSNTGTDVWPLLFRQKERMGPPTQVGGVAMPTTPSYPNNGLISDGGGVFDPNFQMSYVMSWNFSLQREVSKNMVIEARYTGNRALQFNRSWGVNSDEYNIMENGIYSEFLKAQANWYANLSAGTQSWAYTGNPGTSPLPIALAFLQGLSAADANNPAKYTSNQFGSTYGYIFDKHYSSILSYPSLFDGNANYRANGLAMGYPANFFRTNPDKRGGPYIVGNGGRTDYHALTVEFRRRLASGLLLSASFNLGRSFELDTNSLRQAWYKAPGVNSTLGSFKANWIYELPIGPGKKIFSGMGPTLSRFLGGWEFHGMARVQTGNPMWFYDVNLVGMTRADLQKAVQIRYNDAAGVIYWLPTDIINNTRAAYNTDVVQPTGYSTTYGPPQGRYIAPAGSDGCNSIYAGKCANGGFIIYGLPFSRWDLSLIKTVRFSERRSFEIRAEFLNAFNNTNFRANGNITGGSSMGQVTTGYRDVSTTNDTGGRMIQFVARINF